MTDFREDLHPRSSNGQFSAKEGWPPEVALGGSTVVGFRGPSESPSVHSLVEEEEFELGYGRADDEETERILKWVEAEGVTATAMYDGFGRYANASGEESEHDAFNYDIMLRTNDGREFSLQYHMGAGLTTAPTIAEILQSTVSDSYGLMDYEKDEYIREMGGFPEYGMDEDDTRHGDALYEALQKQDADFKEFVGDDFDYIVYGE